MSVRQFNTVLAGDIAAKALTALLVLGLVRLLQPADFALYVLLSSIVVLSATLLSGFFNRHYILARTEALSARTYRVLQVASSAIVFVVTAGWLAKDATLGPLISGLVCSIAAAAYDFQRTHAQKSQAFGAWSRADVLRALLFVATCAPVIWAWHGAALITGLLLAQALAFAAAALTLPALPTTPARPSMVRQLLAEPGAWSLLGCSALVGLFGQLPVLMLKLTADVNALAAFGSAFRYYGLLLGVVSAANVVLLPRIVQAQDVRLALRGLTAMLGIAAALVLVATAVGFFAIPYIDGGKYVDAPKLFALLSLGLVPGLALAPLTAVVLRSGREAQLFGAQLAAVTVCAATVWCFRAHGSISAAAGIPAGVLAQLLWLLVASPKPAERSR